MGLEHQLKELDEILEAIEANTSDSTMRLARSGRDIIDDVGETTELKCLEDGHNMFSVYHVNNLEMGGRSHFGLNKCSRCGFEDPWQYDF